jgi:hypothetical protein
VSYLLGLIGLKNCSRFSELQELKLGDTPTAFEAMQLGEGYAASIDSWKMSWRGPIKDRTVIIDPKGESTWIQDKELFEGKYKIDHDPGCIWATHGVWDKSSRKLLRPNYFYRHPETLEKVDFLVDFFKPFVTKFSKAIQNVHKKAIIFIEPPVNEPCPRMTPEDGVGRAALAPHWYDGMTRKFSTVLKVSSHQQTLQ